MTEMAKHEPGMFCWADLGTTDVAAAKTFYSGLFGWTWRDDPMGDGAVYSHALLHERNVCAIHAQHGEQAKMGVPPHWQPYIAVESADAIAARAPAAGGKVLMGPFDVFDAGRMAYVQDPTGGVLGVWQAKQHIGALVMNQASALCWTEILTTNVDATGKFLTTLFDWKPATVPMPGGGAYTVFNVGPHQPAAGMMAMPPDMQGIPTHWMISFAVPSCAASLDKVVALGGKGLCPIIEIAGIGLYAIVRDPQGVVFGLLQPKL